MNGEKIHVTLVAIYNLYSWLEDASWIEHDVCIIFIDEVSINYI